MKKRIYAIIFIALFSNSALSVKSEDTKVEQLAKTNSSWIGDKLPSYEKGQPEVTILKITIPAKTKLPFHKHSVINAGVLLTGKLTVVSEDGKTLYMNAGDSIVELVNKWHYGINEGEVPAEIIVFYAGVEGLPITTKKAE